MTRRPSILSSTLSLAGLIVFLAVVLALRCWNYQNVFVGEDVYFVDADCYSRMNRVLLLEQGRDVVGRQHFENHPTGVETHTTLPLDVLILGLSKLVGSRDLAGAAIGPLLGVLAGAFLWWWSRRMRSRWMLLALYAASPILVHGTALGRPDHQCLLIALLAVALAGEWRLTESVSRSWGVLTGMAWGIALWVSFYEPLVLFLLVEAIRLIGLRAKWIGRERARVWIEILVVLGIAFLFQRGPWLQMPDDAVAEFFPRWAQSIGELNSTAPWSPLILGWTGLGLLAAPILLGLVAKKDRRAIAALALLLAVWALSVWQIRWGYFLALVFAMTIPIQLTTVPKMWIAWVAFAISLWPMASAWETRLFPEGEAAARVAEEKMDALLLRETAKAIRAAGTPEGMGILAPWWLSPPLAYWTEIPAVAGSSHESLPGTVDAARFYLATSPEVARTIVADRRVAWVVAYEPSRVIPTAASLLGREPDGPPLSQTLYQAPHSAPPFLQPIYANQFFKLFRVDDSILSDE